VGVASETKEIKVLSWEDRHPSITEQIRRFEEAELPIYRKCGSGNTASVQVDIIGRTMELAASTKKNYACPKREG
jgi:hypothetical protein